MSNIDNKITEKMHAAKAAVAALSPQEQNLCWKFIDTMQHSGISPDQVPGIIQALKVTFEAVQEEHDNEHNNEKTRH